MFCDKNMKLRYTEYLNDKDYNELNDIKWLVKCGSDSISSDYKVVESLEKAVMMIEDVEYENFQLDRQADLTLYLNSNHSAEYQEWNAHIEYTKDKITPTFKIIEKICIKQGFNQTVVDSIKWDLVSYFQEKVYNKYKKPGFYHEIIEIYKNGRIPCGYVGDYPAGWLCIY